MADEGISEGMFVIFRSENGRDGWKPVKPEDVPDWVKDPDNMAHMVDGEACMDPTQDSGTDWFMALPLPPQADIDAWAAAQAKRKRRAAKAVRHTATNTVH